jgi:hypothetical protein
MKAAIRILTTRSACRRRLSMMLVRTVWTETDLILIAAAMVETTVAAESARIAKTM